MQSLAVISLRSSSGSDDGSRSGCCGSRQAKASSAASSAPITVAAAGSSGKQNPAYPPPYTLSPSHQPPSSASKRTPVLLSAKRLLLLRPRVLHEPKPNSGDAQQVSEQDFPNPIKEKDEKEIEIDLQQVKSIALAPQAADGKASPSSLVKVYLELHGDVWYKLQFASKPEAELWIEIINAYLTYTEVSASAVANAAASSLPGSTPTNTNSASASASSSVANHHNHSLDAAASSSAAAIAAAVSSPYYAYAIPSIYAKSIESCFDYIRARQGFKREGLFRTGKSSPFLLKQILLNKGVVDNSLLPPPPAGAKVDASKAELDVHVLAFIAKNLLRSLPESLLTQALLPHIFDVIKLDTPAPQLLAAALQRLPPTNYRLLQSLFELMYLTMNSPESRMTAESLTKVVGPNLLPKDDVAWLRSMTTSNGNAASSPSNAAGRTDASLPPSPTAAAAANLNAPAPNSIPMQRFFEMVFQHAKQIFPSSTVFPEQKNEPAAAEPAKQESKEDAEQADAVGALVETKKEPRPFHLHIRDPSGVIDPPIPVEIANDPTPTPKAIKLTVQPAATPSPDASPAAGNAAVSPASPAIVSPVHVTFTASESKSLPPASVFTEGSGRTGHVVAAGISAVPSPRAQRSPEYFEREIERQVVIHSFPTFHFDEEE